MQTDKLVQSITQEGAEPTKLAEHHQHIKNLQTLKDFLLQKNDLPQKLAI